MGHLDAVNSAVAARVMQVAAERGVSHTTLADAAGMTERTLHRRFLSITSFKLPELVAIAGALGVGWSDLMPDEVAA
ncbi:helix-turn-helix transcriptional regulator [Gordonia sp. ABSL49_1]|uniref:helix-turn-helix domain-containing protein n=1 Tax=Gordonia sp. ABSL49_1 TaxID=2920941 RepID=UPI001F10FF19|nr:helix-turn-helix transcriptional regulator [Gordonia sp. ABSL49_1]MCH5645118.1 helix-turn-helix transcriptional regulator [Gordonia sp. ABSL49_1]